MPGGKRSTPRLEVTALDVGHGDAILVQWRDGGSEPWTCLIDGGDSDGLWAKLAAPPFQVGVIDLLVLSHPDNDHLGGLPDLLGRIPIKSYWCVAAQALERHAPLVGRDCGAAIARARDFERSLPGDLEVLYPLEHYGTQPRGPAGPTLSVLSPAARFIGELLVSQDIAWMLTEETSPLSWLIDAPALELEKLDAPEGLAAGLRTGALRPEHIPDYLASPISYSKRRLKLVEQLAARTGLEPQLFGDPLLNNTSLVLYLEAQTGDRRHRILFPGDLENWTYLFYRNPRGLNADLLKAAHHGGRVYFDSTGADKGHTERGAVVGVDTVDLKHAHDEMFINVRPAAMLISANGRHNLPRETIRQAAVRWGTTVFCTNSRDSTIVTRAEQAHECCFVAQQCSESNGDGDVTIVMDEGGVCGNRRACHDGYGAIAGPVINVKQHVIAPSRIITRLLENELARLIRKVQGMLRDVHQKRVNHALSGALIEPGSSPPLSGEEIIDRAPRTVQPLLSAHIDTVLAEGSARGAFWAGIVNKNYKSVRMAYRKPSADDRKELLSRLGDKAMILFGHCIERSLDRSTLVSKLDYTWVARFAEVTLRYPEAMFDDTLGREVRRAFRSAAWSCFRFNNGMYAFSKASSAVELMEELITRSEEHRFDEFWYLDRLVEGDGSLSGEASATRSPVLVSGTRAQSNEGCGGGVILEPHNLLAQIRSWKRHLSYDETDETKRIGLRRERSNSYDPRRYPFEGIIAERKLSADEIRCAARVLSADIVAVTL